MKPFRFFMAAFLFSLSGYLYGDDFIPGEGEIIEKDILRRIEKELGEKLTTESGKKKTGGKSKKRKPGNKAEAMYDVTVILKNNTNIKGKIYISQPLLILGGLKNIRYRIPIAEIRRLKFTKWERKFSIDLENNVKWVYFSPTKCIVLKMDGHELSGKCRVSDWLQLNIVRSTSIANYRIYYKISDDKTMKSKKQTRIAEPPADTISSLYFDKRKKYETASKSNH